MRARSDTFAGIAAVIAAQFADALLATLTARMDGRGAVISRVPIPCGDGRADASRQWASAWPPATHRAAWRLGQKIKMPVRGRACVFFAGFIRTRLVFPRAEEFP